MAETIWSVKQGKKGVYREWMGVRVPFEIKRALERKAKERGLSVSDLVRVYIERCLKEEDPLWAQR
ncbi:MAG: ribbon-helix-helix protein, CopG family [Thermodesulfobacterium sp.]|jgi:predicted HicB family RNase H-like nuclease|nr:ribbon-helix-helix protein, CopG family [Thermodesulfobacterium sp.]